MNSPVVIGKVMDMALGGALWFGMVYGVCSLIIKVKGGNNVW
jgi:hypothetical protein